LADEALLGPVEVHEAAHAVVQTVLGFYVWHVVVTDRGAGESVYSSNEQSLQNNLAITVAGAVGEMLWQQRLGRKVRRKPIVRRFACDACM
jgi:hypothetical protein